MAQPVGVLCDQTQQDQDATLQARSENQAKIKKKKKKAARNWSDEDEFLPQRRCWNINELEWLLTKWNPLESEGEIKWDHKF